MLRVEVETRKNKQIVDITDKAQILLPKGAGLCHLFVKHTTCALTTADLDPGTDLDILDAFTEMIPKLQYRHPHDPAHVPDHILSALIGTSLTIPYEGAKFDLGTWQRIVLVELSGPRKREIILSFISTTNA